MKFNVIVIKRKTIIIATLLLLFICSGFLYLTKDKNDYEGEIVVPTMAKPQGEQAVKKDLNGDGKEDVLYITSKNDKYYVEAHINNNTYFFNEKKPLNTLGAYYSYWPMTINIIDINRDRLPEIIIQSSQDNSPVQHIFTWDNNEFKDLFCSTNNVLGIIDSANNQTPKFLSLTINNGISEIQQHMLNGKTIKNISYENYTAPGLDSVSQFIDLISYGYEIQETPNIFTDNIPSNELSLLWQLDKENYYYTFQDAFFRDNVWKKDGALASCSWTLNFKKTPKNSKFESTQISFKISLDKIQDKFLIKSIDCFTKK